MKKFKDTFKKIVISLLIALAALVVIYTLWFIYIQIFDLPAGYYQHHEGKGAGRCVSSWFCISFWGVECCDLTAVVHQYFSIGLIAFIFIFRTLAVPIIAFAFFSVFFLSFIILYKRS